MTSVRPFLVTAAAVAGLMFQALLIPIGLGEIDIAARASEVPEKSWRMLGMYVVLVSVMGAWSFAGQSAMKDLELGKRLIYTATIAATLPLWTFMNGFLGDDVMDMIPLWLIPFAALISGAAISKDWRDLLRAIVIGFGVPIASMFFLTTFVDFGN
jgi:hypothetical protein